MSDTMTHYGDGVGPGIPTTPKPKPRPLSDLRNVPPPIADQLAGFQYGHLPEHLQSASRPFAELALALVLTLPWNPSLTRCLGHLRDAKDEAVMSRINRDPATSLARCIELAEAVTGQRVEE